MSDESGLKISKAAGCLLATIGTFALLAIFAVGYYFSTYSALVKMNEAIRKSLGNIQIDLKRRADLVPNLANTVKAYATHEKEVFVEVTDARSRVGQIDIGKVAESPEAMAQLCPNIRVVNEFDFACATLIVASGEDLDVIDRYLNEHKLGYLERDDGHPIVQVALEN